MVGQKNVEAAGKEERPILTRPRLVVLSICLPVSGAEPLDHVGV